MEAIHNLEQNDKRSAVIVSFVAFILLYILLYFVTLDRNDPPIETDIIYTEIPVEAIIDNTPKMNNGGGGGGGGGNSSEGPIDPTPKPQTEKIVTNTHGESINKAQGNSKNDNHPNSQNTTSNVSKPKPNNPFADGGNGSGSGGGNGKGNGVGIGDDNGPGTGPGNGPGPGGPGTGGKKRIRLNNPNVDDIVSDVNIVVNLIVRIDADGNVRSAKSTSGTTTTDQRIIDKVANATKKQVKYSKKPGAGLEEQYLTININAR